MVFVLSSRVIELGIRVIVLESRVFDHLRSRVFFLVSRVFVLSSRVVELGIRVIVLESRVFDHLRSRVFFLVSRVFVLGSSISELRFSFSDLGYSLCRDVGLFVLGSR